MDKTFVVGFISFFDNELFLEKVTAKSFDEAISKHSKIGDDWFSLGMPLNEIKEEFHNQDAMVEVIEIE